ncbi:MULTISPECIES: CinA family protein [unclassified Microbacterium]|uniref:CinA family protein n=1 Tax=unclassified Microbacterium TaxID=2609290 RepID=UPI001D2086C8|nr:MULTISPECIES: CinA family protein [unclassified Microbacterium]CAH0184636.1 Nicotinamide-nucleotide amidohydrolase PncC [Microbacterium sp. Bi121]HWK77433.1 CinA family protein [Microbacterium sp.]
MSEAARLIAALTARGWTLGVAESLSGGALTAEIVSVPGASATLLGGVVAYATPVKASLLGVDAAFLDEYGPVRAEVAAQMAIGVRTAVQVDGRPADMGISTTGIAGPDSPDGQPVGTVHIAVATSDGVRTEEFRFAGDRAAIRAESVGAAIAMALATLGE